jgi:hypothetical protein
MSSVCPHGKVRLLLDGFSWSTIFELFCFENLWRKSNFHKNPKRVTGTLREKVFTSMTVLCWIVLRMSSVSDKSCRENGNTHIMFSNFFPENRSVCDLKKCGGARQVTDDNIIRRLWFACWITKTIDTHTHTCSTYCFSTATVVSRTRLNVTLYVHCLTCFCIAYTGSTCLSLTNYLVCILY